MAAAKRLKASDKQAICKKLVTTLKKRYKGSVPKNNRDVLHSMIFCICLEENSHDGAEELFEKLMESFHDLNEIRVSSITELEAVFTESRISEWRALRTRSLLHYIFEENFQYDYEAVRRKTQEQATKVLKKVKDISPFMVLQTLQLVLGSHVLPLDPRMINVAIWLGFVEPGSSADQASDQLKAVVRKNEVAQFCHLIRGIANDESLYDVIAFDVAEEPAETFDLNAVDKRLTEAISAAKSGGRKKKPTKSKAASGSKSKKKDSVPKAKAAAKKAATPKAAAAKKPTAPKKAAPKKAAPKKAATKKAAKAAPAKKAAAKTKKKVAVKKPAAKKKPAATKKKAAKKVVKKKVVKKKTTRKKSKR